MKQEERGEGWLSASAGERHRPRPTTYVSVLEDSRLLLPLLRGSLAEDCVSQLDRDEGRNGSDEEGDDGADNASDRGGYACASAAVGRGRGSRGRRGGRRGGVLGDRVVALGPGGKQNQTQDSKSSTAAHGRTE